MPRVRLPIRLTGLFAPDDDRALLTRFADERDEAAFAVIVARHARMVYGVCRRAVRDEHRAEDAFQAVFLVLARNPERANAAASLGGWLFGIARRVGLAARRHEERQASHLARGLPRVETEPGASPGLNRTDFDDLLRVLDEELAQLPETYRVPLIACFLEERTQDEAAKQLGWSLSTLRRRLERGKELLRARLSRRGATLAGGLFAGVFAPSAQAAVPAQLLKSVAEPSSLAQTLASEVVSGTVAAKCGFVAVALAVLSGLGFALADGNREPAVPADPPAQVEVLTAAPGPREATAWVNVSGRVVFPEERTLPKVRFVDAGGIKDADFFPPAGKLTYGDLVIDAKTRGLGNAVVWLRPDSDDKAAKFPADKIHPKLAAKSQDYFITASPEGFIPRVVATRAGDRLVFGNPTPIAFNVHCQPVEAQGFNVLLPREKSYTSEALVASRTAAQFTDHIHPWINGYVWTFDHPYFAVTDVSGNFTIPNAPRGTWRLMIWHERVGYRNGAAGKLGEPLTIRGDGKMELGSISHLSPGWDDKPDDD